MCYQNSVAILPGLCRPRTLRDLGPFRLFDKFQHRTSSLFGDRRLAVGIITYSFARGGQNWCFDLPLASKGYTHEQTLGLLMCMCIICL
jgi:hypothetical protein